MPTSTTDVPFHQFLDALPDGVIFHRILPDSPGQAPQFELIYYNEQALEFADLLPPLRLGERLEPDRTPALLTEAYRLGEAQSPPGAVEVRCRKLADGVLTLVRADSSQRFQQVLDQTPVGIVALEALRDATGRIVDFRFTQTNEAGWKLAGLGPDTIGRTLLETRPGHAGAGLIEQYARVAETGEPFAQEVLYDADGLQNWYAVVARKLDDGIVLTFQIITEQKTAHAQAEEQAQLFDGVLNASLNGIITYRTIRDEAGRIIDFRSETINSVAARILHLSDQVPGWRLLERFPGVGEQGVFARYVEVVETGQPLRFETNYDADGVSGWYDVAVVRLGDGFVITFNDISENRRSVWEIERQRSLLSGVIDTSLNGTIVYEALRDDQHQITDLRFRLFNETARQDILRRTGRDITGNTLLGIYPDSRQSGLFALYTRVIEGGQPVRLEHYYADFDVWFDVSINRLEDGCVVTFIDVSDSKRATRAIEQQSELLSGVLDGSVSGILACRSIRDAQGVITDFEFVSVNQTAAQMILKSLDELIAGTLLTLFPGTIETGLFALYCRTAETGEPGHMETYYHYDGLDFWLDVTSRQLGDGLVITFTDVSEAKHASQAIERAAQHLQGVIDYSQTGIFVFSPVYGEDGALVDFRFKTINRMVAGLVGQTPDVLTGAVASDWFNSYRETGLFDRYRHTFETGEDQRFDIHYAVDGFDVWFDVKSVKFGDDVLVTFTDYTNLKQAQRAVEGQADLLNTVLNSSTNGITALEALRDERGRIVDYRYRMINEIGVRLGGKTAAEIVGGRVSELYPAMAQTGVFELYERAIETHEPQHTEFRYLAEGLDVWLDVAVRKNGDGVVVTYTDVTQSKQATRQIEEQANLLNSVLNSSINGIMAFTSLRDAAGQIVDFTFVSVNESACEMVGKTTDELLGKPLLSIFPGNVESGLFAHYVRTTETGEPGRTEVYYALDGLDFWLDVSFRQLGDGFVVTFTDISIVKRAAQQIERSAQELQTVIDTSQTGIFLFTPIRNDAGEVVDFRFRVANRQLAAYVGQEPKAVIGALGSQWFPGYQTNGLFERYRDTYLSGEANRFAFHYDDDGINVWLDIMATKMGDEVLVTFADYTPLKQLQLELEGTVQQLQVSNENLERFAYVASHDLQEPLRKIQSFGDMIFKRHATTLAPDAADKLGRMQAAAERMQALINDLLAYSRLSSVQESFQRVDLSNVLAEVRADLEVPIREKRASLTIDALPVVAGDHLQLRQLFQNLLSNALKFTPSDTAPRVEVRHRLVRGDEVPDATALQSRTRYHEIRVRDNGIGFEQQYADQVFEAFRRLHNRSEYPGTGIGLAIVKKVVENHHGDVVVQSQPGQGTTFRVYLPINDQY